MQFADAPFFVLPPPPGSVGVDFLGLRATNLSLMAQAIPGINNVVQYIRPFSLIAWMVWHYEQQVTCGNRSIASRDDFVRFTEKVEALYVWSHQLNNPALRMPGIEQSSPLQDPATLNFLSFSRTSQTSFFAAANYGPASKSPFGLGFITPIESGLFATMPAGAALAKAFDQNLRRELPPAIYKNLADIDHLSAKRAQASAIYGAWSLDRPSGRERAIFAGQLFQPNRFAAGTVDNDVGALPRSAFIELIRRQLKAAGGPTSVSSLRQIICARPVPAQEPDDQPIPGPELRKARALWQVLQVRQAQRLAFEALFGVAESLIWEGRAAHSADLADIFMESISSTLRVDSSLPRRLVVTDADGLFSHAMGVFETIAPNPDALFSSMLADNSFDIFTEMAALINATKGAHKDESVPTRAFVLLALVAVFAIQFEHDPLTRGASAEGSVHRLPLSSWGRMASSHRNQPLRRLVIKVVESFIVSQHFATAASRFSDEKSRLRFTLDEAGLTSLLTSGNEALSPTLSKDRLASLLRLCCDAGLAGETDLQGNLHYFV